MHSGDGARLRAACLLHDARLLAGSLLHGYGLSRHSQHRRATATSGRFAGAKVEAMTAGNDQ
jgi:hypothetical protein